MIFHKSIDKDFYYTLINQGWRFVSGPIMLFCIPLFLTAAEQGYWYTFASLAALSVFADFGFTFIVLQFSAHAFAPLKIRSQERTLCGSEEDLIKLSTFYTFSIKWALVTIFFVFPIIAIYGYYFLQTNNTIVNWQWPWIIYVIATTLQFFVTVQRNFFEGCDSVSITRRMDTVANIISSSCSITILYSGGALYALAISVLIGPIIESVLLFYYFKPIIKQMLIIAHRNHYSWFKEFTGLLWKYAVSWISAYFLVQFIVPVSFKYFGAIEAGKIGFTIALLNAMSNFSRTWIFAITPKLNIFVENRQWKKLHTLFMRNNMLSLYTFAVFFVLLIIGMIYLGDYINSFSRLANFKAVIIMGFTWFGQLYYLNGTAYLRAFKQEPLMQYNVIQAVIAVILTYLCAIKLSADYLFLGSLFVNIIMMMVTFLYIKKQRRNT